MNSKTYLYLNRCKLVGKWSFFIYVYKHCVYYVNCFVTMVTCMHFTTLETADNLFLSSGALCEIKEHKYVYVRSIKVLHCLLSDFPMLVQIVQLLLMQGKNDDPEKSTSLPKVMKHFISSPVAIISGIESDSEE